MTWDLEIENVAGILTGSATLNPGLNAVRASNWQGKSSFVASVKTALGIAAPLTEGRDSGRVAVETPDRTVEVELERAEGTVRTAGRPFLTDEYDVIRTDLFACLDERNAVRRAVRRGENLESVLLKPLDFQNIDQQIAELKHEREQVGTELAQAREAAKRLPSVESKVARIEDELDDLRSRREDLPEATTGAESGEPPQSDLAQAQSERDRAEKRVERLERRIERTESRLEDKREELAAIDVDDETDVEAELAAAREQLQEYKRDAEVLQSVYSATQLVLEEDRLDLLTEVQRSLSGDAVECWTCGSEVSRETLEGRLEDLGDRVASLRNETESQREVVEDLEAKREDRKQAERRKRDLEAEVSDLEATLRDHRESLDRMRDRLSAAADRVEELSAAVDETVESITDVESEIKYREAELADLREEREALESRAEQVDALAEERDAIDDEIESLRNRKDRITFETREAFDEAMQDILARFDTGFETARLTGDFEVVVARDGREASLDALSEGELELIGFVAALAGYETFDVEEVSPVMLVDSVGALADDNLHTLIEYLRDRTEYLVFTVYPEYTAFEGNEIDPTGWNVATDREATA